MILKCFKNRNWTIKEARFVFLEAPSADAVDPDDHWYYDIPGAKTLKNILGGVGDVIGATGTIAGATARLAGSLANLVDLATVGIAQGMIGLEKGGANLYNYLKDKYKGLPENLREYDLMSEKFKGLSPSEYLNGKSVNSNTIALMHIEYRKAILDALIYQVQILYNPVMFECDRVKDAIDTRNRLKWKNDNEMKRLNEKIGARNRLLREGNLGNGSMKAILLAENEADQASLDQLNGETSKETDWEMPQLQKIEFPAGSGTFITRYVPGTKKIKVNLDKLYDRMKMYARGAEPLLLKYTKEKIKLNYQSDKILDGDKATKDETKKTDTAYIATYKGKVGTTKGKEAESLQNRVTQIRADTAVEYDSKPRETVYNLIENPFEVRKSSVGTGGLSKEYVSWLTVKKIPEKLVRFGCILAGGKMVKMSGGLAYEFTIGEAGDLDTKYPDNLDHRLPPDGNPADKNAWNPHMP